MRGQNLAHRALGEFSPLPLRTVGCRRPSRLGRVGFTGGFSGGEFPVSRDLNEPLTVSLAHVLESPQQFRSQSVDRVERTFYQLLPGAPEMRCQSLGPLNGQLPLAVA